MTWQKFVENNFIRLVLVLWFISSFLIIFLLGQLDWIVHNELYNFGLQFNQAWAQPYWIILRVIHIWLIAPSILCAIALGLDLWKKANGNKRVSKVKLGGGKVQPVKVNSMLISCPSCKKTFSKPLIMLDFSSKNARLINVCPYCNAKLGDANEEDEKDLETGVLSPDEKVKVDR